MKRALGYAVQVLIVGLIFFFLIRNLAGDWAAAKESLRFFKLSWLIASMVVLLLAFLMLVEIWRWVLSGAGATLPIASVGKIWFASDEHKQFFGKAWQILETTLGGTEATLGNSPELC